MLALFGSSLLAFDGSADAPTPCCFTLGFASNQVPCCLNTEKNVASLDECTLKAKLGESIGFSATYCPTSADEAQCIVQASPIVPSNEKLSTKKTGPECAFMDEPAQQGNETKADSDDDRIPDPPVAPVKESAKQGVQPLINSEALRLRPRSMQPN
jgi:hypothetical protein